MADKSNRTPHDPNKPLVHKNPPKETQLKKDNPGGPGRPKGVVDYQSIFRKIFGTRITVTENGKRVSKSMGDALAKRGQQIAFTGPHTAYFLMLELYQSFAEEEAEKAEGERVPDVTCLGYDLVMIYVAIIQKTLAYDRHKQGEPLEHLDGEYVGHVLGTWEFFLGEDGHTDVRKVDNREPDNPFLSN